MTIEWEVTLLSCGNTWQLYGMLLYFSGETCDTYLESYFTVVWEHMTIKWEVTLLSWRNIIQLNGKLFYCRGEHMAIELKVTFLSYGIYDNWMESYFNIGGHMSNEWKALSWGTYDN